MKRAEWLQDTRKVRFEEAYGGWQSGRLTQEEATRLLGVCERTFRRHIDRYEDEASHTIEKLTGLKPVLSACRDFMRKHLGMKCRKMGAIPSKVDPDKQKAFLHDTLEPLLEEEKQGKRRGYCLL